MNILPDLVDYFDVLFALFPVEIEAYGKEELCLFNFSSLRNG